MKSMEDLQSIKNQTNSKYYKNKASYNLKQ